MLAVCRSPLVMLALLATLCSAQFPDDPQPLGPPTPGAPATPPLGGGQGGGQGGAAPSAPTAGANDEEPKLTQAIPGTRASINGHAITAQDVLVEARLNLISRPQGCTPEELADPPEDVRQKALANAAREILLSSEAERLGVNLTEFEFEERLRASYPGLPPMDDIAEIAGTTPDIIRARFRRQVMATIYTRHRLGRDFTYAHLIQPNPLLKRLLEVRPADLKREFLARREQLALPERVGYRVHAFSSREEADRGVVALQLGHEVFSDRQNKEWHEPLETALTRVQYYLGSAEVTEWFREAPAGAVSEAVQTIVEEPAEPPDPLDDAAGPQGPEPAPQSIFLVVQVLEREPPREADFALDQEQLLLTLLEESYARATRALVLDEARNAVVWPPELFSAP